MKKHYNIPTTNSVSFRTSPLCDIVVASVQGGAGFQYSGAGGGVDPV